VVGIVERASATFSSARARAWRTSCRLTEYVYDRGAYPNENDDFVVLRCALRPVGYVSIMEEQHVGRHAHLLKFGIEHFETFPIVLGPK
jgi:hypothetical protein